MSPSNSPRVTVLTNIYNERENLAAFLDSLVAQTYRDFDVLIVDDGSTDSGLDIVRQYEETLPLRIMALPHMGLRPARAAGFDEVTAELCAIFDADEVLDTRCLELLVQAMDETDAALACGHKQPIGEGWITQGAGVLRDLMTRLRSAPQTWAAVGGVLIFRTEIVRELGGLARDHKVAEDTDLSWQLRARGYELTTVREAVVGHHDPVTAKGQFLMHTKIGRRMVHTFLRHPRMALRWESWARFFAGGIIGLTVLRGPAGLAAWVLAFCAFEWKIRRSPAPRAAKLYSFPVLVIQSLGWTFGFLVEPMLYLTGKRTTD